MPSRSPTQTPTSDLHTPLLRVPAGLIDGSPLAGKSTEVRALSDTKNFKTLEVIVRKIVGAPRESGTTSIATSQLSDILTRVL